MQENEPMMSDREIETLAELISIKTADRYLVVTKELIAKEIKMHATTCENGKFKKVATAIAAIVGGGVATILNMCIAWLFGMFK
jgi:hypothetical protein